MPNKLFLNKRGFIEQVYEGKQTFYTVCLAAKELMFLIDDLQSKKKKVRVLVNLNKVTKVTVDSIVAAAESFNLPSNIKIAVFGGKALFCKLANLVIYATGKQSFVKVFKTRSEAEDWLKG